MPFKSWGLYCTRMLRLSSSSSSSLILYVISVCRLTKSACRVLPLSASSTSRSCSWRISYSVSFSLAFSRRLTSASANDALCSTSRRSTCTLSSRTDRLSSSRSSYSTSLSWTTSSYSTSRSVRKRKKLTRPDICFWKRFPCGRLRSDMLKLLIFDAIIIARLLYCPPLACTHLKRHVISVTLTSLA